MGLVPVGEGEGDGDAVLGVGGFDADDSVAGGDEAAAFDGGGGTVRDENRCLRVVVGVVAGPEGSGSGGGVLAGV